ncbi:MAG: carboxypeptidase regulatory-like domain-containing protein [Mariniblastus sp.]
MRSKISRRLSGLILFVGAFSLVLPGCGGGGSSDVGLVTGNVSYMGKPVTEATISFHPTTGRGSGGKTDAKGNYSLTYTRAEKGALIGQHKITITTDLAAEESRTMSGDYSDVPEAAPKGRAEFLPAKYTDISKTVLTAEVVAGKNTIDFALEK